MELPYYRHEFERKKRSLEKKRLSDGWLNDEVGYGHDSWGNLVDGLGNPIKGTEMVEEEEDVQDKEELRIRLRLRKEQEDIEKWPLFRQNVLANYVTIFWTGFNHPF
jgi:hypothetical protein